MSLQGRNAKRAQAAPSTDAGIANQSEQAGGGVFGGAGASSSNPRMQRLAASAPELSTMGLLIFGLVLGMVVAYIIIPTELTGASPRHMSQQAIQQWVRMVSVGHSEDIHYDDANALLVLQQIPNPQGVVNGLIADGSIPVAERAALQDLTDITGFNSLTGALAPQDPGIVGSSLQVIAVLAIVALGVPILVIAGRAVNPFGDRAGSAQKREDPVNVTSSAQTTPSTKAPAAARAFSESPTPGPWTEDETEKSGVLHPQFGVPVMHTVSTYVKGRNYDDSFAIELGPEQENRFLGECGVSVATRVGNELQSVEIWGFDMASQETVTKVFAAPAALSDPALQAAVANRVVDPMSDIVAAEPGARLTLESNAIQIQAEVKSVVCNYGGGTPNSGIETLQIELLAWHKQGHHSAMPAAGYPAPADSPFNQYADIEFSPPSQTTSPTPPPPAGGMNAPPPSGTPAPAKRPEDEEEEEDPFGGTGNFMPFS